MGKVIKRSQNFTRVLILVFLQYLNGKNQEETLLNFSAKLKKSQIWQNKRMNRKFYTDGLLWRGK